RQLGQDGRMDLVLLVVERVRLAVLANDLQRGVHGRVAGGRRGQWRRGEQVERGLALPDGAVDGTAGRLVLRAEEFLDLLVGFIESAGTANFLLALTGLAKGGLGEALLAFRRGDSAHGRLASGDVKGRRGRLGEAVAAHWYYTTPPKAGSLPPR